jgi:hypothetical protein
VLQLQRDPTALAAVAAAAGHITRPTSPVEPGPAVSTPFDAASCAAALAGAGDAAAQLAGLGLPLGWTAGKISALADPLALVAKLFGLLVTALAVSLGAPFWFDTLQLFLNIRTAGPKPARSGSSN